MKEEATQRLFLFSGGGRGRPWGRREAGCRWRLARSGSVWEEEEKDRRVPWQVPSLRENIFPEIHQGRTWAKWANEGRRQPRKEWDDTVKKEEGRRWGRVVSVWASRQAKAQGGERGVGWPGWKERRAVTGLNLEPGQNSKRNSFRISIDFRIWQNFEKLYKEI
jgi:hypothetical protein